ncbi:hypothetical protein PGT21_026151 [Puccinia graminis f. sp. tritici]|nr:hypothetical protein PGT21_026151 [Puccinia graminis f. sp. tritici]
MIPPRLAHHLQSLITRKVRHHHSSKLMSMIVDPRIRLIMNNVEQLLESPVFNEFVARTDGAFHSIRLGLKEGWQEGKQESSTDGKSSKDDQEPQKPNKTTQESKSSSRDRRKTVYSTEQTRESKTTTDQDRSRLDTEQKLQELLEKLRRQQPKS